MKPAGHPPNTVLVALLPTVADWQLARDLGIYRIPVRSAPVLVKTGALTHIAFYFPKAFGAEACTVRWYAAVSSVDIRKRREILPGQPNHPNAETDFYVAGTRGVGGLLHRNAGCHCYCTACWQGFRSHKRLGLVPVLLQDRVGKSGFAV